MQAKTSGFITGAAIAMLLAVPAAQASSSSSPSVTDWGVHDYVESSSEHVAKGCFDDIFSFSLSSAGALLSFATSIEKVVFVGSPPGSPMSIFSIDDGKVSLYRGIFGDATPDTQILTYQFDGGSSTFHSSAQLAAGNYFYEVSGKGDGQGGGFFNLTSTLAPVPEPETYGMLLAGLGLMGFVARRRIKRS